MANSKQKNPMICFASSQTGAMYRGQGGDLGNLCERVRLGRWFIRAEEKEKEIDPHLW